MTAQLTADQVHSLGLTGRDFLRELDFTLVELNSLLDLAARLKQLRAQGIEPELLKRTN
jgi:ornithine carbamoyltransferase